MGTAKIRLEQIEGGRVLRELITWYETERRSFSRRFNALRLRSRQAASRAGIGRSTIDRLIRDVRSQRG